MDSTKRKYGWTALGVIGWVFAPIGLVFSAVALAVTCLRAIDWNVRQPLQISFGIIGVSFLTMGLIFLGFDIRRRRAQRRAVEGGYYVMARVAAVRVNYQMNVNGVHPVRAECHYTDPATGTVHVYFSRNLYTDVTDLVEGREVPVYMDRLDPSVGYVDIDSILPEIVVHG